MRKGRSGKKKNGSCILCRQKSIRFTYFLRFIEKTMAIKSAFQDNFDTPKVVQELLSLISAAHGYLNSVSAPPVELLQCIASYVSKLLQLFGVAEHQINTTTQPVELVVNAMITFRNDVKRIAHTMQDHDAKGKLFQLCDSLRDSTFPELSIRVEVRTSHLSIVFKDQKDGTSTWKFVDKDFLQKQKEAQEEVQGVSDFSLLVVAEEGSARNSKRMDRKG